jgi:hypothetical protein
MSFSTPGTSRAIVRARRANASAGAYDRAVHEHEAECAVGFRADGNKVAPDQDFGAQPNGLAKSALGEFASADPVWESRIVLDSRTRSSLSARSEFFQQHRIETFGSSVHGGSQAGRPRPDDNEVIKVSLRPNVEPHTFGEKGQRLGVTLAFVTAGPDVHASTVFQQEKRQLHACQRLTGPQQEAHQRISLQVYPPGWHAIALQKIPVFLDIRRRSPAHDVDFALFSLDLWHVSFHAVTYRRFAPMLSHGKSTKSGRQLTAAAGDGEYTPPSAGVSG